MRLPKSNFFRIQTTHCPVSRQRHNTLLSIIILIKFYEWVLSTAIILCHMYRIDDDHLWSFGVGPNNCDDQDTIRVTLLWGWSIKQDDYSFDNPRMPTTWQHAAGHSD